MLRKQNDKGLQVKIATHLDTMRQRIQNIFKRQRTKITTPNRACLYQSETHLSFLAIDATTLPYKILDVENDKLEGTSAYHLIKVFVKDAGLHGTPLSLLLHPTEYEILLLEALPIPKDELKEALTWRVRSLVSYAPEDILLDYIQLPGKKNAPDSPLIAAIVSSSKKISNKINQLKDCGLLLKVIDIPELAMRNLTIPYENDEKSSAFIYFFKKLVILNITRQKQLFFTRRVTLPKTELTENDYEQIGLEILRYFDYYQSQWRFPTPTRIFIASEMNNAEKIALILSDSLMNPVIPYKIPENMFNSGSEEHRGVKEQQNIEKNLLALGGLLRGDNAYVAPRY